MTAATPQGPLWEMKALVTVSAVNDGADAIHGFVDLHRPETAPILDVPHVLACVAQAGLARYGAGGLALTQGFTSQRQAPQQGETAAVLRTLRRLAMQAYQSKAAPAAT